MPSRTLMGDSGNGQNPRQIVSKYNKHGSACASLDIQIKVQHFVAVGLHQGVDCCFETLSDIRNGNLARLTPVGPDGWGGGQERTR